MENVRELVRLSTNKVEEELMSFYVLLGGIL